MLCIGFPRNIFFVSIPIGLSVVTNICCFGIVAAVIIQQSMKLDTYGNLIFFSVCFSLCSYKCCDWYVLDFRYFGNFVRWHCNRVHFYNTLQFSGFICVHLICFIAKSCKNNPRKMFIKIRSHISWETFKKFLSDVIKVHMSLVCLKVKDLINNNFSLFIL